MSATCAVTVRPSLCHTMYVEERGNSGRLSRIVPVSSFDPSTTGIDRESRRFLTLVESPLPPTLISSDCYQYRHTFFQESTMSFLFTISVLTSQSLRISHRHAFLEVNAISRYNLT